MEGQKNCIALNCSHETRGLILIWSCGLWRQVKKAVGIGAAAAAAAASTATVPTTANTHKKEVVSRVGGRRAGAGTTRTDGRRGPRDGRRVGGGRAI